MRPILILAMTGVLAFTTLAAGAENATDLVQAAVDYYRGEASRARVRMVIHRPEWERSMLLKAWTEGRKKSLFYIVEPAKDKGNGTLKRGSEMWTYNPKVNRVIKLPPSMMSQSWMGSDFSNNDLAKSDSILDDYSHSLEDSYQQDGKRVYVVRCVPKPAAPVVWGMQKLHIREDLILLREEFYDEDRRRVKYMVGSRIEVLGGKLFPRVWKMQKDGAVEEYTRLEYQQLEFVQDLPDRLFTVSALRNPGR